MAGKFLFYHYDPSLGAAVLFIILFGLTTFVHSYQLSKSRTWYLIPVVVGGLFETIGYIGRAISAKESPNWTLNAYIIQTLLLLVAPAVFAASVYMILGRIIRLTDGEELSPIRSRWLTKIFVGGDVLSFFTQGAGGGLMSSGSKNPKNMDLGSNIVLAGLCIQILFFGLFVAVSGIFHHRLVSRRTKPTSYTGAKDLSDLPWFKHLVALYASSALILIRSIFRVIEYAQGFEGSLLSQEWTLYVFDSLLMFGVMLLMNIVHPGEIGKLLKEKERIHSQGAELGLRSDTRRPERHRRHQRRDSRAYERA